jgi:facilitated trehalose transporter
MAYSAILLPQLQEVTRSEASWIASIVTITLPIGSLMSGPLMDRFGRQKLSQFSCFVFIVAWLVVANHSGIWMIYVARALSGVAGGLTTVGLVYVSEISHKQMRPVLMCFNSVFVAFGILLTYAAGALFEYRTVAYIFCGLSVLTWLAFFLVPESPYWLAAFGEKDREAARTSLSWLYRKKLVSKTC